MYDINKHGSLISEPIRIRSYADALARAVKPGSVVVDIGTGTGIFALLACKFGASRVYAIEPDPIVQLAAEFAVDNGFADRIEFIQKLSSDVTLPQRADVIVSDLRGVLPLLQSHIPTIVDARNRFLAPGGTLIPQSDTLWVSLVDAAEVFENIIVPWRDSEFSFNLSAGERFAVNLRQRVPQLPTDWLMMEPRCWGTIDYRVIEDPHVQGLVNWTARESRTAHGFALWFDAELADEIGFSTAPSTQESVYGNVFIPFAEPVRFDAGDIVELQINASLIDSEYLWGWTTRVLDQGRQDRIKIELEQSDLLGRPLPTNLNAERS